MSSPRGGRRTHRERRHRARDLDEEDGIGF
jgi:hypothetical protein